MKRNKWVGNDEKKTTSIDDWHFYLFFSSQLRHELDRVRNERDRMLQENSEIGRDKQDADTEKLKLKSELKDLKFRETRMLADYSELEEENITLQKQVSNLRCSQVSILFVEIRISRWLKFDWFLQVEFETAKYEIRRLSEEIELLNSKCEELGKLKQIAEKQMEEALEALQVSVVPSSNISDDNNVCRESFLTWIQ